MTDRENLEWLVWWCLWQDEPVISASRARELLGFRYTSEIRKWYQDYHLRMTTKKAEKRDFQQTVKTEE